jgi:hypothetical protein
MPPTHPPWSTWWGTAEKLAHPAVLMIDIIAHLSGFVQHLLIFYPAAEYPDDRAGQPAGRSGFISGRWPGGMGTWVVIS